MSNNVDNQLAALIVNQSPQLSRNAAQQLIEKYHNFSQLFSEQSLKELPPAIGLILTQQRQRLNYWCDLRDHYQQQGISLLSRSCEQYPVLLKTIKDPPSLLYVKGDISCLNFPQIGVVGSRQVTRQGIQHSHDFAQQLSKCGFTITSGLANGVDTCAHQGALKAKGLTIAVLGGGLLQLYPKNNQKLAQQIVDTGGCLISEYAPELQPKPAYFPLRNRIISGMSLGVLVVEASLRSGSLITARLAAEQGREIFAIPGSVNNSVARGCHQLIRNGALLVENYEQIVSHLGPLLESQYSMISQQISQMSDKVDTEQPVNLNQAQQKMLQFMGYDPITVDQLVLESGDSSAAVAVLLMELELQGLVVNTEFGYQRLR